MFKYALAVLFSTSALVADNCELCVGPHPSVFYDSKGNPHLIYRHPDYLLFPYDQVYDTDDMLENMATLIRAAERYPQDMRFILMLMQQELRQGIMVLGPRHQD